MNQTAFIHFVQPSNWCDYAPNIFLFFLAIFFAWQCSSRPCSYNLTSSSYLWNVFLMIDIESDTLNDGRQQFKIPRGKKKCVSVQERKREGCDSEGDDEKLWKILFVMKFSVGKKSFLFGGIKNKIESSARQFQNWGKLLHLASQSN